MQVPRDHPTRTDNLHGARSQVQQGGDEFTSSGWSRELEHDRSAVGLDRDDEAEEPAALAFGIHNPGKGAQRLSVGGEAHPKALRCQRVRLSTSQQFGEQSITSSPESLWRQRAGDRGIGHGFTVRWRINHPPANRLCMTVADAGHADRNSMEAWTDSGTAARVIVSNPNLVKNPSAVVVSRNTSRMP
jgi:hypothetical protein